MTPNNNSIATINQQLTNLGTINQQLSTLSQQLSGLNQQHQNLQHFQNFNNSNAFAAAIQPLSLNSVPINHNNNNNIHNDTHISSSNNNTSHNCIGSIKNPESLIQADLFQSNQELLNRLQNLTLGFSNNNSINHINNNSNNYSPHNAFMFGNPSQLLANQSSINHNNNNNNLNTLNNNNINLLSSPSSVGNLTPSPIFNRSSYSSSPMLDNNTSSLCLNVSVEKNLDRKSPCRDEINSNGQFIRPISTIPHDIPMPMTDSNGKLKITIPISASASETHLNTMPSSASTTSIASSSGTIRKNDKRVTLPDFKLKITDECGNITNARKLSATPSLITRSTSEKVSNRSQIMNEVQRTTWARHTTK